MSLQTLNRLRAGNERVCLPNVNGDLIEIFYEIRQDWEEAEALFCKASRMPTRARQLCFIGGGIVAWNV